MNRYYVGLVNGSRDGAHEDLAHLYEDMLTPDPGDRVEIFTLYATDAAEALHNKTKQERIFLRCIAACVFCGTTDTGCRCYDDPDDFQSINQGSRP